MTRFFWLLAIALWRFAWRSAQTSSLPTTADRAPTGSPTLSGGLASMGAAVPYAIGASSLIALVGDGAMQMNNMAELITVQKYWKRWADPRLVVCVFINQVLTKSLGNSVMEGNPKFNASQDIPDFAYAKFGEMLGFRGIYVDSPDRLASAWQESLASDRPVVIEVKTDPEIVPLPRI